MKKLQARCGGWVDRKRQEAWHLEEEKMVAAGYYEEEGRAEASMCGAKAVPPVRSHAPGAAKGKR